MTGYAVAERLALADLMAEVGPQAPTLCGDWRVRDLVAHLLLRERRPDAAAGILLPRLAQRTEAIQQRIAARDFPDLLHDLRNPPWWSPVANALLDEPLNLNEMFVHHEDVRRATEPWQPRELPPGLQAALWGQVRRRAKYVLRRWRSTVRVSAPGYGEVLAGSAGSEPVTLEGAPSELALFLSGRQAHARIVLEGPAEQVERLTRARLGI
jgi:uncharacterized protein (TIGR03085 family)